MALAYLTINLDAFTGDDRPPLSSYSTITLDPGADHIDAAADVIHVRTIVVSLDQQGKAATANGVPCVDGKVPVVAGVMYAVLAPNVLRDGPHYIPALTAGQVVALSDYITPGAPLTPDQAAILTARIKALEAAPPGAGVTDHGALTGLGEDDHTQYALANGTRGAFAAPLGADDNYVTDAEKAALHAHSNKAALDLVSGTNTGDQVLPTWSTISGKPAVVAAGVDAAAARTALSLGDAATKNTGTTAGTVAAGDDSRIGKIGGTVTVSGTPTAGQVPIASSGTAAAWGTPSGGGGGASVAWSGVNVGDHLPVWANGGHAAFSMITTRIIPCPLVAIEAMNVDAVSIYVETGVATSTVDLALYTYNMTTGKPGSFVQHLATIDTSTSGLKTATFAPIALAAGIHVVIGRANTANVTLWGVAGSVGVVRMTSPSGGSNQYTLPHATWTGTVPSWPSSPTWDWNAGVFSAIGAVPKLQLRRSA